MDTPQQQQWPAPRHGEHAADLIFDTAAGRRYGQASGGAWIYPACYDDIWLCRRRAESLARGFSLPFAIDLFGADGDADDALTPSVAVSMPGYYAYTLEDPRPRVIVIVAATESEEEATEP